MTPDNIKALAEMLKRTVRLARAYATETGSIFEDAMTAADRLADRAYLQQETQP